MKFKMYHSSLDVLDMDKSIEFYKAALGLEVIKENDIGGSNHRIVYVGTPDNPGCLLELNWFADRKAPYDLGENPVHQGFRVDNYEAALAHHREMGCVVKVHERFGVYYIADPDGYILEIVPTK